MNTAILIDDNVTTLERLEDSIQHNCPDVDVLSMCTDAYHARDQIIEHQPDMVFLDVEMNSISGFDLISSLPSLNFALIILSAHEGNASKAFAFKAADYLIKPIEINRLQRAVLRAKSLLKTDMKEKMPLYLANVSSYLQTSSIPIPTQHGYDFERVDQILYIQADGNYSTIYFNDGRKHYVSITLKRLEEMLFQRPFVRIHQSFLINLEHIKKYYKGNGGYVVMSNGKDLAVSRRSKENLMQVIRNMQGSRS